MHDLAMFVGIEHYPWPHDFADEARTQGISKAISPTAIPEIIPGVTRLVFIHPKACVLVTAEDMGLFDLAWELMNEHGDLAKYGTVEEVTEYVHNHLIDLEHNQSKLGLTRLLHAAQQAKDLKRLEEKYGIAYKPSAFFGFTFLTGIEYVAKEGELELPEHLQGKGIEIVEIVYSEENDETDIA